MQHEWILDVIADIKAFARQNDLPALASHMDTAWLLASAEIASLAGDPKDERTASAAFRDYTTIG